MAITYRNSFMFTTILILSVSGHLHLSLSKDAFNGSWELQIVNDLLLHFQTLELLIQLQKRGSI